MALTRLMGALKSHVAHLNLLGAISNEQRTDHATNKTMFEELIDTLNELITDQKDQVLFGTTPGSGVGLAVDGASALDVETTYAAFIQHKGQRFAVPVTAALDISASSAGGGTDTISTSKAGVLWVVSNTAGGLDAETPLATQIFTTAIEALAEGWTNATKTLPPGTDDVVIGVVQVTEGGSGAFTWGADSITDETEAYYSLSGLPGVVTRLATLALDAAAATFTYGAGVVRLGTGTLVTLSGKVNVALPAKTNVATAKTGAWLIYTLADDSEYVLQLGAAYATLATAQAAVRDHSPNPLLPVTGVMYVVNTSGANFVPGTTNLDATGIATTFVRPGPGANHLEIGRAQLNQPHQVIQNSPAATMTAAAINTVVS